MAQGESTYLTGRLDPLPESYLAILNNATLCCCYTQFPDAQFQFLADG